MEEKKEHRIVSLEGPVCYVRDVEAARKRIRAAREAGIIVTRVEASAEAERTKNNTSNNGNILLVMAKAPFFTTL